MRKLLGFLLVIFMLGTAALAQEIQIGEQVWAFPEEKSVQTNFVLRVYGQSIDPESFETLREENLPGTVLGVYAKNARGEMVPLPDPENPGADWVIKTAAEPLQVSLPEDVDVYLRLLQAPEGYVKYSDGEEYAAVSVPGEAEYSVCRAGMTGIYVTLQGSDGAPLSGAELELQNGEETLTLITDAQGRAKATDLSAGSYRLLQTVSAEGYSPMAEEMTVQLSENEARRVDLFNARHGSLVLTLSGRSVRYDGEETLEEITREYVAFDENGRQAAAFAAGEEVILPSAMQGRTYTIQSAQAVQDGYEKDSEIHRVTIWPGEEARLEITADSLRGYLKFSQTAAGGVYRLEDLQGKPVLEFEADEQGQYFSDLLPEGTYILRQIRAAEGCVYTGETAEIVISPYLPEKAEPETVFVSLQPVPESILAPEMTADAKHYPSLFEQAADVSVSVSMMGETEGFEIRNFKIALNAPDVLGVQVLENHQGDMQLTVMRRARIPGAEEIRTLNISGTVSYEAGYPVNGQGEMNWQKVESSFNLPAAYFDETAVPEALVYGTVVWENGEAASGIPVRLRQDDGQILQETVTDAAGAYGFSAESGNVQILSPEGYGAVVNGHEAVLMKETTVQGELILQGDLEGGEILLSLEGADDIAMTEEGSFSFSGLIPQDAQVTAKTPEGMLYESKRMPDGSTQVTVYPEAAAQGWVCLPDGQGIEGVTVENDRGGMAVTDEKGFFRMNGLQPGDLLISVVIPENLAAATESEQSKQAALISGETADVSFMLMEPARVSGRLDNEQIPMAGVELTLQPGQQTCVTGEDGSFAFENLILGEYEITADLGQDAVLEGAAFEITQSAQQQTLNICAIIPAGISGQIWEDADNDGFLVETEGGLPGAVVELVNEQGETVSAVTTERDGLFDFGALTPGTYSLRITLPEDMIFSKKAGSAKRLVAGINDSVGQSGEITLGPGEKAEGLSAGAVKSGRITGQVWLDQNADGYWNGEEKAFEQAAISLLQEGQVMAQTRPDENGFYEFTHIRVDNCQVQVQLEDGYLFTRQIYGSEGIGSNMPQEDDVQAVRTTELRIWHTEEEVNVGVVKAANLTARVWLDEDADGQPDGMEKGMEALEIRLYDASGSGYKYLAKMKSDGEGMAAFEALRPDRYMLEVIVPDGYAATTDNRFDVTLTEDCQLLCGLTRPGTISGVVFRDDDMDGLRGEKEDGISAVVELLTDKGELVAETLSGRGGAYQFENVHSGLYQLRFTLEENQRFTHYASSAPSFNSDVRNLEENVGTTQVVYLPMGEEMHLDAGVYQTGLITGEIWQDADDNRRQSRDEACMGGVTVTLLREDEVYETLESLSDGSFAFNLLPPGQYRIQVEIDESHFFARSGDITGEDGLSGATEAISIDGNRKRVEVALVPAAQISGNTEESGALVRLMQGETLLAEQVTDENGDYAFDRVRPGQLTLHFIPQGEWTLSNAEDAVKAIKIGAGEEMRHVDVEMIPGASVGGMMWLDANWNGQREAEESGCEGVKVVLSLLDEKDELETIADADGFYSFQNLRPGQYEVHYELPEGVSGKDESIAFALKQGEKAELESRGMYQPSRVEGIVWEDVNGNGKREEEEGLISGVKAQALSKDGTVLAESVTGEDGRYALENLPPVECIIRLTLPKGYLMVDELQTERTLKLSMDEAWSNMDAAVLRSGRIGDTVWLDENNNGLLDTAEQGVSGVKVSLWLVENGEKILKAEKTTDANGRYRFTDVRPGKYILSFEQVSGYAPASRVEGFAEIDSNLKDSRDGAWWTEEFNLLSNASLLRMDAGLVPEGTKTVQFVEAEPEQQEETTEEAEEAVEEENADTEENTDTEEEEESEILFF